MAAAPQLRVVDCEECERLRLQRDALLTELETVKADLDQKRRQLSERRNIDRKALQTAQDYEVAEKLFEYWKEQCGHPRAKFGPARQKALYKAMEFATPREIATAIKGAAVAAWVDEKGVRHDGLSLICRDEEKLDNFTERYERWKEAQAR